MSYAITPEDENKLDAVIEKIDKCLPKIEQRAKDQKHDTGKLNLETLRKTQAAFKAMEEDSVLTKSGEDVHLEGECDEQCCAKPKKEPIKLRYRPRRTGT